MSSLIELKHKCVWFQLNTLFFSLLLCRCWHLTDTTIILTIIASPKQLFAVLLTTANVFFRRNFTQIWLNSYRLVSCFVFPLPFYIHILAFTRTLSRTFLYEHSHTCLYFFPLMLVVVVLFRRYPMYLLAYICVLWICVFTRTLSRTLVYEHSHAYLILFSSCL